MVKICPLTGPLQRARLPAPACERRSALRFLTGAVHREALPSRSRAAGFSSYRGRQNRPCRSIPIPPRRGGQSRHLRLVLEN